MLIYERVGSSVNLASFAQAKKVMIMKAFILKRYGKNSDFYFGEIATPSLADDEVLIEVYAAGVNVLDSKIKNGEFKLVLPYKLPLVLGHDVAGKIVKVGSKVKQFKPGDEVYSRPDDFRIGAFSEFIAIKEDSVAIKPQSLSMEEAASIPLVGLTAWQALIENANLKKGQKIFIQAGSGGVGTFAIQLAKHIGAFVATTTSAENIDWVKGLGADIVINYKKEDFENALKNYDVVLNSQDAKTLEKSLSILRSGGKLISISGPPDLTFANQIRAPWFVKFVMYLLGFGIKKKAQLKNVDYSFLFMRANGDQLRQIATLVDSGEIRPVVDRVFPFESIGDAISHLETGRAKGKVVIKMK